jgi:hypothetical protein
VILVLQFVVVPAFNIGVVTHAPTPAIRPATTLGYAGSATSIDRFLKGGT